MCVSHTDRGGGLFLTSVSKSSDDKWRPTFKLYNYLLHNPQHSPVCFCFQFPNCLKPHYSDLKCFSDRSDDHRAATEVDVICNFHSYSMSPGVNQDQLFWELSHGTHGITHLGPYTLDQNSLYINGESPCLSNDLFSVWSLKFCSSTYQFIPLSRMIFSPILLPFVSGF